VPHLSRAKSHVHPQLWRAISVWRTHQHRLCRIHGKSGDQQALLQEAADAMDQARGASVATNAGEIAQSGTWRGVPALVPGSGAGSRVPGSLIPSFLMLLLATSSSFKKDHGAALVAQTTPE